MNYCYNYSLNTSYGAPAGCYYFPGIFIQGIPTQNNFNQSDLAHGNLTAQDNFTQGDFTHSNTCQNNDMVTYFAAAQPVYIPSIQLYCIPNDQLKTLDTDVQALTNHMSMHFQGLVSEIQVLRSQLAFLQDQQVSLSQALQTNGPPDVASDSGSSSTGQTVLRNPMADTYSVPSPSKWWSTPERPLAPEASALNPPTFLLLRHQAQQQHQQVQIIQLFFFVFILLRRHVEPHAHLPHPLVDGHLPPLVIWDTGYTLGRPHTMPGGSLHWPVWAPYKLYGEVDHIYGWKAYNAGNGFTAAQGLLNAVETVMYIWYLWIYFTRSKTLPSTGQKVIAGKPGAKATLIGFSAAVMTLSKTVLYWANEYYSGFDNIGHNALIDLIFLWIIPKYVPYHFADPELDFYETFLWNALTPYFGLASQFLLKYLIETPVELLSKLVLKIMLKFPIVRMIEPASTEVVPLTSYLALFLHSGAWLVGSTYMVASMGGEIIDGLAGHAKTE
ncbi:hypothetical protein PT974_08122 [Cladobotryum mycophilum]|uniref:Uncharacterized protein n=1 Tax=Cladobotryum mycophilum TaxID=491253 RepID=A0ABR0SCH7_9HYPO